MRPSELAQPSQDIAVPLGRGDLLDDKYLIDGVVGRGGMSHVLSATHVHLEARVAIKVLRAQWASSEDTVERFLREGKALTRIRGEHVVRVLDVGISPVGPYLVMEYLEGRDLAALLEDEGPLPIAQAVDYVLQACEAIAEGHAAGVIHRDLKPANLFLAQRVDGTECIKVLDFGISKISGSAPPGSGPGSGIKARGTRPRAFMGSPQYMSPEQMRSSGEVDERTDIWSLGAVLYELVAGRPPFVADSIPELCLEVVGEPPMPLSSIRPRVPPMLDYAVLRSLAVKPESRYANVLELARALGPLGSAAGRASVAIIERMDGALDRAEGGDAGLRRRADPGRLGGPRPAWFLWMLLACGAIGAGRAGVVMHHVAVIEAQPSEPFTPAATLPDPDAVIPASFDDAPVSSATTTAAIVEAPVVTAPPPITVAPAQRQPRKTATLESPPDDDNPYAEMIDGELAAPAPSASANRRAHVVVPPVVRQ